MVKQAEDYHRKPSIPGVFRDFAFLISLSQCTSYQENRGVPSAARSQVQCGWIITHLQGHWVYAMTKNWWTSRKNQFGKILWNWEVLYLP